MGLVCTALLASPIRRATGSAPRADVTGLGARRRRSRGALAQTRRSARCPSSTLPETVGSRSGTTEALEGADLIVCAVPVQFIPRCGRACATAHPARAPGRLSVAKGIENDTLMRPTQIIADVLRDDPDAAPRPLGTLSGSDDRHRARPVPAGDDGRGVDHPGFAERLQALFTTSWLRVYTNPDLLGVELAGAVKNIIAIAAGIIDGLDAGSNAKSALLARGLAEITRLGRRDGGHPRDVLRRRGRGRPRDDVLLPRGAQPLVRRGAGRGAALDEHLGSTDSVVEGVATTRSVMDLAARSRVEMPIARAVHAVLFEKLDPVDAVAMLMSREPRDERVG